MYDMISNDQLKNASPSVLAAENGDVEKAIEVLKKEADQASCDWVEQNLRGSADFLENEVL